MLLAAATLVAAGLAAWSARTARADEAAHPPAGRFVEVDGARVHYLRRGPAPSSPDPSSGPSSGGPTLVFLHGASTSLLDAVPALLPALAERFDVVAIDRPGHGYSERGAPAPGSGWVDPLAQAERVAGALDALGVERPVWIGHSWAGAVTLAALLELPEDDVAAGVVLAGAIYPWDTGSPWHVELAALPVLGPVFAGVAIEPAGRLALEPALRYTFAPEAVPEGYVEATGTLLSLRPRAYRHNAVDLTRLSGWLEGVAPRWSRIERPVLSIAAGADRVVPPARHADRLEAARPATTSVTIDGAGHGLIHTRAARIADEIEAFAAGLGTPDGR